MRIVKIELTEQEISNLLTFLNRVELKGIQENAAYMTLVQKVNGCIIEEVDSTS